MWPDVVRATRDLASGEQRHAIRQKQTGADTLTLGGAVACNAHGRGLMMGPIGEDVESLTLVDADGEVVKCSRDRDAELFRLVIGGYGLFGVVVRVTLRLCPRRKLQDLGLERTCRAAARDRSHIRPKVTPPIAADRGAMCEPSFKILPGGP